MGPLCLVPALFLLLICSFMFFSKPEKIQKALPNDCPECNNKKVIQITNTDWFGLYKKNLIICEECGMAFRREENPNQFVPIWKKTQFTWLEKCPVCKKEKVIQTNLSDRFGTIMGAYATCEKCQALFMNKEGLHKLIRVKDASASVWLEYSNKILSDDDWKRISNGEKSIAKQREDDLNYFTTQVREGKCPIHVNGNVSNPVMLQKGEKLIMALPSVKLLEPRAVSQGYYGGPSVRVSKGFYLRGGVTRSESHEELRHLDEGTFVLTNKRLIFSGRNKTIEILFNKIVSIIPYTDGISISRSGKERREYFVGSNAYEISFTVEKREYKLPMSGEVLMNIIEGLTKIN
jgi:transcription elongation factor Elf1